MPCEGRPGTCGWADLPSSLKIKCLPFGPPFPYGLGGDFRSGVLPKGMLSPDGGALYWAPSCAGSVDASVSTRDASCCHGRVVFP